MNAPNRRSPSAKPQQQRGWRRFFTRRNVLIGVGAVIVLGIASFAIAWATTPIPSPNALANAQASIIYYSDGKTEMDRISDVNRESVHLSQVPLTVQRAVLAAEDRNFYTESGVSPTGIARALVNDLKGGATQGGSTITQQYVKNYFLTQDQTINRKLKELIISLKIDQQQSKSQILENYLNTIYFGRGAYGIQTAAHAYFGKDVSKLTVGQGALLAAVVRGPSLYDPRQGTDAKQLAEGRVGYVLDGMVTEGWLTPAERAKVTFPVTIPLNRHQGRGGQVGYITALVKSELKSKLNLTDADIDRGGLRITTTINHQAQVSALKAVADNMPDSRGANALQVGLTAVRPGDGAIVAMYGGRDYQKIQFNNSTDATMQAGSTFKAFGLLAAVQKQISTKTRYDGHSPQYFPEFVDKNNPRGRVPNFGNEQFGKIDLRKATAHSVNTVFAQLNIAVTPRATMDAAIQAGIPRNTKDLSANYSNILGTASPHVIDMANAYATIASQGLRATPYLISRVTSETGGINFKAEKHVTAAFDKAVTADVTEALTHVVTEGTGTGAQALGRPAAGKTGTTNQNRAVWFDGFTPQLAAAVGIFQGPDGTQSIKVPGFGEVTGGTFPVKIWTAFMQGALKGLPVQDFPKRAGIGDAQVPTPTVTVTPTTSTSTTSTTSTTTTTTVPPTTTTTAAPSSSTISVPTTSSILPTGTSTKTKSPAGGGPTK